jgi:hypothetical protein
VSPNGVGGGNAPEPGTNNYRSGIYHTTEPFFYRFFWQA